MELDLSEYDQVDEIKLIRESHNRSCNVAGSTPIKFIAASSSCSDQASFEEANYENDFVFLPAPTQSTVGRAQQINQQAKIVPQSTTGSQLGNSTTSKVSLFEHTFSHQQVTPIVTRPLMITQVDNIANNPFGDLHQKPTITGAEESYQQHQATVSLKGETCASKPAGLLEVCPNTASNPDKLTDLMRQIVTKSDRIYIAIPCAYCHEQIACPPTDISSWLNHMSYLHNCKLCPICNKMIGLGPRKAIEIMKRHVMDHLDNEWLERRAMKVNFSFGLQQQWFSGSRCSVRETHFG